MRRGRWEPTHPGSAVVTLTLDGHTFVLAVMDARTLCEAGLAATSIALSSPIVSDDGPHGHISDAASLDEWMGAGG